MRLLRRLLYCGEWIESHALHVFMLHAPDFLGYDGAIEMARDHPGVVEDALQLKKAGNTLIEVIGGRAIHPVNVRRRRLLPGPDAPGARARRRGTRARARDRAADGRLHRRARRSRTSSASILDDPAIVAGPGPWGSEPAEQVTALGTVVVPVGGGGLAAGVALALRARRPGVRIVGVQAERCSPLAGGTEVGFTIAEGIAVKRPGAPTAPLFAELLDDVVAVSEEELSETLVLLVERSKLVVEGAGAAALAAVLAGRVGGDGGALAILSGGNIDPTLLISVMRHGLTHAGRSLVLRSRVPDRPGELIQLLRLIAAERVNVVSVEHHREGLDIPMARPRSSHALTRDTAHCDELVALVEQWGYPVDASANRGDRPGTGPGLSPGHVRSWHGRIGRAPSRHVSVPGTEDMSRAGRGDCRRGRARP